MSFFKRAETPFVIAGPCSAETREQLLATVAALQGLPVHLIRAGVWKPRTKPGSFEGQGEEALIWLQEAKTLYGFPTATEVAEPHHIELALKQGIDVLWIGARTTVNPFHVQRLADALKGADIPVMIKNPVTPDVDLWEGAIERFERAGIKDIAAVHRGFSMYQSSSPYRNPPNWVIPIELKRRRPDMSIICDPSHIAGNRNLVPDIAQKGLDMGFEGLMIETHPHPDEAWSDAAQQITPAALKGLLDKLVVRTHASLSLHKASELDYLRQLMDTVDTEIIDLLARRMELSIRMGHVKKECNMAVYDADRWREIVRTRTNRAEQMSLQKEYILGIYEKVHHQSIKKQLEIFGSEDAQRKD